MLIADASHTALGPMAGYLFQPDRALVILCDCGAKQSVSIELVDDLAVIDGSGNVIEREQAKNTIQVGVQTFSNRSKDLWGTLDIWCSAVKNGEINIDVTKLVCVTNVELEETMLVKKIGAANSTVEIQAIVNLLKTVAKNPSNAIRDSSSRVLSDEDILKDVIAKVHVVSGSTLDKRNEEIAEKLHLPDTIKDNVIESLRGWLHESILRQIEIGSAPVISKKALNEKLSKVIKRETDDRIVILAKSYVRGQIAKEKIDEATYRNFVRQLELIIHIDKSNIILDAIDDFLCSETERTRLTVKGDLTRQELEAIDETSKERWKEIFRKKIRQSTTSMSDDELGTLAFDIYSNTLENYLSKIRGFDTEPYFTKGSFHKLAEELQIGWHPKWETYFPDK